MSRRWRDHGATPGDRVVHAGGRLSDRYQRHKPFRLGRRDRHGRRLADQRYFDDVPAVPARCLSHQSGPGLCYAVDIALVVSVLPSEKEAARALGQIANGQPQSPTPLFAPLLLVIGGGGNYPAVFVAARALRDRRRGGARAGPCRALSPETRAGPGRPPRGGCHPGLAVAAFRRRSSRSSRVARSAPSNAVKMPRRLRACTVAARSRTVRPASVIAA